MFKVRSLLSGIGGLEKALTNLELPYEITNFSEVSENAVKVYCLLHNVEPNKNIGDIMKVKDATLPYADLQSWNFPIISFSSEDKTNKNPFHKKGLEILKATQPKYSIIENVASLSSGKLKNCLNKILNDLDKANYYNFWNILNVSNYNIPQDKKRLYIVSIRKDLYETSYMFPKPFECKLTLKDLLDKEIDDKYYVFKTKIKNKMILDININKISPSLLDYMPDILYIKEIDDKLRKLTSKEYWKLSGFTEEDYNKALSTGASEHSLYLMPTISTPVNCMYYMLKNLLYKELDEKENYIL